MYSTKGYAARSKTSPLSPFSFDRRDPGPTDVQIDILFCGVCHSDIHTARGEWGGTKYPCVPGHEIVGRVVKVGRGAKKFSEGELAAVGCMVDSCRTCDNCRDHLEQFCDNGPVFTYNSDDKQTGMTYGGYSKSIVVDQDFVLRISEKHDKSFDFILDTVSAPHDLDEYLSLLKRDGTLVLVGASPDPLAVDAFSLIHRRRRLAGSLIGGIAETQEMLDYCAERGIVCEIEKILIDQINEAYERMLKSDVKYRFVIDMASL